MSDWIRKKIAGKVLVYWLVFLLSGQQFIYSLVPVFVVSRVGVSATLGVMSLFPGMARAEADSQAEMMAKGQAAVQRMADLRAQALGNLNDPDKQAHRMQFVRPSDQAIESGLGQNQMNNVNGASDTSVVQQGNAYRAVILNSETPEGDAYRVIQGIQKSTTYQMRDEDAIAFAKKLTGETPSQQSDLTFDFIQNIQSGTSCSYVPIGQPTSETLTFTETKNCAVSEAQEVYYPSSCKLQRELTLPRVHIMKEETEGDADFSRTVQETQGGLIVTERYVFENDGKTGKVRLKLTSDDAELLSFRIKHIRTNQYTTVKLNGETVEALDGRPPQSWIDSANLNSVYTKQTSKSYDVPLEVLMNDDQVNYLDVNFVPTKVYGPGECRGSELLPGNHHLAGGGQELRAKVRCINDDIWLDPIDPRLRKKAVVDWKRDSRGRRVYDRDLKEYLLETKISGASKIVDVGQGRIKVGQLYKSKQLYAQFGSSTMVGNFISRVTSSGGNDPEYPECSTYGTVRGTFYCNTKPMDKLNRRHRLYFNTECYAGTECKLIPYSWKRKQSGWSISRKELNEADTIVLPQSYYGLREAEIPGKSKVQVELKYQLVIEEQTESPLGCYTDPASQVFARGDGVDFPGIQGMPWPAKDGEWNSNPYGQSDAEWICSDHSPSRKYGSLVKESALPKKHGLFLQKMHHLDNHTDKSICYTIEARNYVLDITGFGLCTDGTFSCYGFEENAGMDAEGNPVTESLQELVTMEFTEPCEELDADESCALVETPCLSEHELTGQCRIRRRTYECSRTETRTIDPGTKKLVCSAPVPCMSGECGEEEETVVSTAFGDAAGALGTAQFAQSESTCMSPEDPSSCRVFSGKQMSCRPKVGLFGETGNNCCDSPTDVSPGEMIRGAVLVSQTDYFKRLSEQTADELAPYADMSIDYVTNSGAWRTLVDPSTQWVADNIYKPMVTTAESLYTQMGGTLGANTGTAFAGQSISGSMNFFADAIMEKAQDMMGDTIGDILFEQVLRDEASGEVVGTIGSDGLMYDMTGDRIQNTAGKQIGTTFNQEMTNNLMNGIDFVSNVYTAYVVAKLVYDMVTQCEPSEFETAAKLKLESCILVDTRCTSDLFGSCLERKNYYCCYTSPLSRIIQEQVFEQGQLGRELGNRLNANCSGFTMDELELIDFDRISFDEWVNMLQRTGTVPDPQNNMDHFFREDKVTKTMARAAGIEDQTDNATERALNVLEGQSDNAAGVRQSVRQQQLEEINQVLNQ